jgi:LCP family protein required for cell wall assembly
VNENKINLLAPLSHTDPRSGRRRFFRSIIFTIVILAAFFFTATAASPGEHFAPIIAEIAPQTILRSFGRLFVASERGLDGESEDRVNVLLLGIGGAGHDGPLLTDTIILLSYQPSTKRVALISIPRDLVVEIPNYGWRKINSVNAFAEMNERGSGPQKTAEALSSVLGVKIHYHVRVDFAGFKKMIDELDGVLVYVERSFTDASYPAPNDEYQTVSFKSGWQRMNGETALVFARSRHGSNFEGSDFARSRRQQKILSAIKEELLTSGALLNPAKLLGLLDIVKNHLQTNFEPWELVRLSQIAKNIDENFVIRKTLEPSVDGPLMAADVNGAYVLVPKDNDFGAVQSLVRGIFSTELAATDKDAEKAPSPGLSRIVKVEIQNGTGLNGFASKTADSLKTHGFQVSFIGNAPSRSYERTVIYDLSGGRFEPELRELRELLDADVSVTIPEWFAAGALPPSLVVETPKQSGGATADFLIILGKSSASLLGAS